MRKNGDSIRKPDQQAGEEAGLPDRSMVERALERLLERLKPKPPAGKLGRKPVR